MDLYQFSYLLEHDLFDSSMPLDSHYNVVKFHKTWIVVKIVSAGMWMMPLFRHGCGGFLWARLNLIAIITTGITRSCPPMLMLILLFLKVCLVVPHGLWNIPSPLTPIEFFLQFYFQLQKYVLHSSHSARGGSVILCTVTQQR